MSCQRFLAQVALCHADMLPCSEELFQHHEQFSKSATCLSLIRNSKSLCMNLFVWTETLATGNKFIYEDHHELVRLVNAVLESIALEQSDRGLITAMKELVAHAREHFAREELEMKLINFKNIDMHTAEHATLLKQVQDTQYQLEVGKKIDQMDLYHFLAWWVKDHIRQLDVELAAALASRG